MTGWGCNVRQQRLGKRLYPNQARGRLTAAEGRSIAPQRTAREKTLKNLGQSFAFFQEIMVW
ncbi:hypothetical protein H6G51_14655 [Limnothrix sp. FACHB-708]|uniref:hypothetical protein n=1 Tax=unclassified Limnothrix TaxID=2632864 RepID=UPI001687A57A|nr:MULTISPECIES: hypothetical protein [unclassified Limnothrix]MBD2554526.1 hypothetical protein [Limnothrix sp. FACHB-708]MBD2591552.1 hypothetical protein [Limnothrix sp. FACHB-406]